MRQSLRYIILGVILLIVIVSVIGGLKYRRYLSYIWYYVSPAESYIQSDTLLNVDTDTLRRIDAGYGDWLVHPCVRYIPEGLGGHQWWLAVTPYPEGNSRYENPVLYYGDGEGDIVPKNWKYAGMIQEMPKSGYNADPNLYYDSESHLLYIIWKECNTPNTKQNCQNNAIMFRTFDGEKFGEIKKLFDNTNDGKVRVTAPTLIKIRDSVYCFATDFEHERQPGTLTPRGKSGIAVWHNGSLSLDTINFSYVMSKMPRYKEGFDFWHTEFIYDETDKAYYSVVTNENAFDILLGVSKNGFDYTYIDKPLISFTDKRHQRNLYKASLVSIKDKLYVFYPKRSKESRTVHLYYSSVDKSVIDSCLN